MRRMWFVGLAAALAGLSPAVGQRKPPSVVVPPPMYSIQKLPTETYGAWVVESMGQGVYAASVENETRRLFGALCDRRGCSPFLDTGSGCKEGAAYGVLINSPASAFTARPVCKYVGKLAVLVLAEGPEILEAMSIGGVIGFATPMASGEFKVSRFTLTGSARAYARALQLAQAVPPAPANEERL